MTFKNKLLISVLALILTCLIFYKPLLNYFINQSSNPNGFVGYIMTKIWNKTFDNMTNWALLGTDIEDNDVILDIGCGGGETIYKLASKTPNGKVYGIDISSEAVKSSLKRNQKWVEKDIVEVLEADVAKLPFENNTFNKITAIQTHIYWDNIENGFKEIQRTLKKDGLFILACEKDKIQYHMNRYKTSEEMKDLLSSLKLNVINTSESKNWIKLICKKEED